MASPLEGHYREGDVQALLTIGNYETAGALGNGATVWGLAKLPNDSRILGTDDITKNYLLFCGAYDGSMANTYKLVAEGLFARTP